MRSLQPAPRSSLECDSSQAFRPRGCSTALGGDMLAASTRTLPLCQAHVSLLVGRLLFVSMSSFKAATFKLAETLPCILLTSGRPQQFVTFMGLCTPIIDFHVCFTIRLFVGLCLTQVKSSLSVLPITFLMHAHQIIKFGKNSRKRDYNIFFIIEIKWA